MSKGPSCKKLNPREHSSTWTLLKPRSSKMPFAFFSCSNARMFAYESVAICTRGANGARRFWSSIFIYQWYSNYSTYCRIAINTKELRLGKCFQDCLWMTSQSSTSIYQERSSGRSNLRNPPEHLHNLEVMNLKKKSLLPSPSRGDGLWTNSWLVLV